MRSNPYVRSTGNTLTDCTTATVYGFFAVAGSWLQQRQLLDKFTEGNWRYVSEPNLIVKSPTCSNSLIVYFINALCYS
jgi:hypothetical protein